MLVYDSLNDGRVVRVDSSFGNMETVFFTGGVVLAEQQGDGSSSRKGASTLPNGVQEQELMAWCHTEIQVPPHDTAGGRGADNRRTDQGGWVDGVGGAGRPAIRRQPWRRGVAVRWA